MTTFKHYLKKSILSIINVFLILEYPNITAMAAALNKGNVSAILLEIHTTSGTKEINFKSHDVEIGKTVDYGYYFGMHLHHVFRNACIAIRECVQELVDGEEFQSETLKVSIHFACV